MQSPLVAALLVLGLAAPAGCATTVADECPETQNIRCLTRRECSRDDTRDCQKCRCADDWNLDRTYEEREGLR